MKLRFTMVLVVLGLALLLAGPTLAAIVWEWHAGNPCRWIRSDTFGSACTASGIVISSNNQTIWMTQLLNFAPVDYQITTTCPSLEVTVIHYPEDESENTPEAWGIDFRDIWASSYPCYITDILIDDGVTPPTPVPGGNGLLADFAPVSLFGIAGELVTHLGGLIAIVGGVLLGFRLSGLLIRWLKGRW